MTDHLNLELKVASVDDSGEFTGYASVFGEVDAYGDVVERGAFAKSLATHRRNGRLPPLLWMHDPSVPIGKLLAIKETAEGLEIRGKLALATAKGAEAYAMLKDAVIDGLSIGFTALKSARTKTGRILQEISLVEVSLVALPALASARVTSVKELPTMSDDIIDDGAETAELPIQERIDNLLADISAEQEKKGAELQARLDRIETRLNRPGARIEVRDDAEIEREVFDAFLRRGPERMGDYERKTLSTIVGSPDDGGHWTVPETFLRELQRNLVEISPMRQIARVQTVSGNPVKLPKRTSNLTAGWVAETAEHSLSEPSYGQQEIPVFEARVSVEITNELLEDSAFDLAAELARDFAEEFGRLEGVAFVSGNGTTQPEGFTVSSAFTTTSGDVLTADDLIDLYHSIPSVYAGRGTWVMRRETIGTVRKLKITDGPYIWQESLQPGNPPSLLGRPVVEMPDMEVAGSPSDLAIAFGDWNRAYRVFDRTGLEVLRDPYTKARNSMVVFHARRRVGGALVDGQAVKGLLVAA